MSRQHRREKAEKKLRALEEDFAVNLLSELRLAARGNWGMFGAYANLPNPRDYNDSLNKLHAMGREVNSLRTELGMSDFDLYTRYSAYCRRHGPNDPGEPRLAQEFLSELDLTAATDETKNV